MNFLPKALFLVAVLGALALPVSAGQPSKYQESIVWSFGGLPDAEIPQGRLVEVNGKLYGATANGGLNKGGAVYALDPSTGVETVLHSFCGEANCIGDGQFPEAGLIYANGLLYGTTLTGGANGGGTLFSIDPNSGTETILHSFCSEANCTDGERPRAELINVKGVLYSTTSGGGPKCQFQFGMICGTVFSYDLATGEENLRYVFDDFANGNDPATLTYWKGKFYGTTAAGGGTGCGGQYGCGTLFSLDPKTWAETVLYKFCSKQSCADGYAPSAGLTNINGLFYGMAFSGGRPAIAGRVPSTFGAIYAFDPATGDERTVYSFCSEKNCTDGEHPSGGLTNIGSKLYGTTQDGGTGHLGTVFSVDPNSRVEKALHSFQNGKDGQTPQAGLTAVGRTLYGTTIHGNGQHDNGVNGVVFALTRE